MSTEDAVRRFIVDELRFKGSAADLTDDYPLLEREAIDSLGILRLVSFLEDELGIEVDDEDLVPDNFASVADIASLVHAKQRA